ncbi:MAG: hypothetical protein AAF828_06555, partial [Bacteroidota bacterium]
MNTINLDFYLQPPELTEVATLEILALAPLSMVANQPGTYFNGRSQPTPAMVQGVLENALGWHFEHSFRRDILKSLAKKAKKLHRKNVEYKNHPWLSGKAEMSSGSGYFSLLQYH